MPRTIRTISASDVAEKWSTVTPGRSGYYESGTAGKGGDWESKTKAAKGSYKAGVSVAGIENRYAGGVGRAGGGKWERKVKEVGVSRFGPGIGAAKADYAAGAGDFLSMLSGMSIPDRGPRGDPGNYAIVAKVGEALHAKRLSQLGASK
jgi:hypothetical protein